LGRSYSALSYLPRDEARDAINRKRHQSRQGVMNPAKIRPDIPQSPVAWRWMVRDRADKPELKESTFLSSRSAHSNAATSSDPASRSTTPTPGNPHPDAPPPPPVARSGMLKIRVTAAKGLALPQGGASGL